VPLAWTAQSPEKRSKSQRGRAGVIATGRPRPVDGSDQ
jgi:hypothetical protein